MKSQRTAGILLIVAGLVFLAAALLDPERTTLRFVAAGALLLAGAVRLVRARGS
jgi:hypothetical protein